jgi:hypothetical protein
MPIQILYVRVQGLCHYIVQGICILQLCYSRSYKFGTLQFSKLVCGEEVKSGVVVSWKAWFYCCTSFMDSILVLSHDIFLPVERNELLMVMVIWVKCLIKCCSPPRKTSAVKLRVKVAFVQQIVHELGTYSYHMQAVSHFQAPNIV